MKNLTFTILILLVAAFAANSQTTKMSSVYTTFTKDCKPTEKATDQEVPFVCKAVGGFRARIMPAGAWAEEIEIINAAGEVVLTLGTQGYGYTSDPKRVLEWRLANGKPFAVIFRVGEFDADKAAESGDNPYLAKYKKGEKLLVRGLTGYTQIDFEVNAREKNANVIAQSKADSNFQ